MFAAENCIATHLDSVEAVDLLINYQWGDSLIHNTLESDRSHDMLFYKVGITEYHQNQWWILSLWNVSAAPAPSF
jgi:hypothetical protein